MISHNVAGTRRPSSSMTGCLVTMELPKSPWTVRSTYRPYWTKKGLSSPRRFVSRTTPSLGAQRAQNDQDGITGQELDQQKRQKGNHEELRDEESETPQQELSHSLSLLEAFRSVRPTRALQSRVAI